MIISCASINMRQKIEEKLDLKLNSGLHKFITVHLKLVFKENKGAKHQPMFVLR